MLSHRRNNKILKRKRHYARIAEQVADRLAPAAVNVGTVRVEITREEIYYDAVTAHWPEKGVISSLGMRHIAVT